MRFTKMRRLLRPSVEPLPLVGRKFGHRLEHVRHYLRIHLKIKMKTQTFRESSICESAAHLQLVPPSILGNNLLPIFHDELESQGPDAGGAVQVGEDQHVWK